MPDVERVERCHSHLYLVESVHEGKTVRQHTIKSLRRKDSWLQPATSTGWSLQ